MDVFDGNCQRCFRDNQITIMSWFNTDIICEDCSAEERKYPNFKEAVEAEHEAVRKGNFNYEGIGLPFRV